MIDIEFFAYFTLLFAILSLWLFESKNFSLIFTGAALVLGLISENIGLIGLLITLGFLGACMLYYRIHTTNISKILLWLTIILAAIAMRAHIMPGFYNWQLIDAEILSDNAHEYSLWLNMDTALVGLGILLFGLTPIHHLQDISRMFRKMTLPSIIGISIIASIATLLGVVQVDAKMPQFWLIWMIINLMITCVSEEALFRFFIQQSLQNWLQNKKYGVACAIFIAALANTFTHFNLMFAGYMTTVFVASLFYGYVYYVTKRVEASILLHFAVNISHFFFFTYPMLQLDYGL